MSTMQGSKSGSFQANKKILPVIKVSASMLSMKILALHSRVSIFIDILEEKFNNTTYSCLLNYLI